jgi:large subunit ribosomal protein L28
LITVSTLHSTPPAFLFVPPSGGLLIAAEQKPRLFVPADRVIHPFAPPVSSPLAFPAVSYKLQCSLRFGYDLSEVNMPRVCHFTGKKTHAGRHYTTRGKAKYLGGVGTKTTGISKRTFKANIQRVRAVIDGQIVRIKVSAKAIRNGLIVKPIRRKKTVAAA